MSLTFMQSVLFLTALVCVPRAANPSEPSALSSLMSLCAGEVLGDSVDGFVHLKGAMGLVHAEAIHGATLAELEGILDSSPSLVSSGLIEHGFGSDFSIVKRIVRDGEVHTAVVPTFPIGGMSQSESAKRLVGDGFTLVINRMHRRHLALNGITSIMERELGHRRSVTANMYLTPSEAAGFDEHYDHMPVVVLHLSPSPKLWKVYEPGLTDYPLEETKSRPTPDQLLQLKVNEVMMETGDALYIPAGYVHAAQSTGPGDSLHLTFGLELQEHHRVRSLLPHPDPCVDKVMMRGGEGAPLRRPRGGGYGDYIRAVQAAKECGITPVAEVEFTELDDRMSQEVVVKGRERLQLWEYEANWQSRDDEL